MVNSQDFDLNNIFIGRQHQLEIFSYYLQNWQNSMAQSLVDLNPILTSPSPNNKIQGFVTLLYGRGGFGKSSLLKRYRERSMAATPKIMVGKIVDWEFAIQDKRSVFNPPEGQAIDAHEYFKVLIDRLAFALQKKSADFKEYQVAVQDVEKAQKSFRSIVDSMQKDDRYSWLRSFAVDAISTAVRTYVPGSAAVLANAKVQTAANELAKLTQAQIVEVHTKMKDKLGNRVGDYLDPALRLSLAVGYDLNKFAQNSPLFIFFDTYEEIDEGDYLLRNVMHAAGERVGWVLAGRDNLWAGLSQRKRSTAAEYGYKDLVPSDRGLSINFNADDIGTFTLSDIVEYFQLICTQIPTLPPLTEEETEKILDVTLGIPLAIKIAAGLYIEIEEINIFTEKSDGKHEIVDVMVRRYLQHTQSSDSEKAKLYALALLRRADQPLAVATALGLTPEQAKSEYATALSSLHRRYSFIFTEKEQPSLHQEVRHFLRLWLLEHNQEPHIKAINERLYEHHKQVLQGLEERRQYQTLKDRLQDTEWANSYLDLVEQQFWLNPSDGVRAILPFLFAAAIYQRDINQDAIAVGAFFQDTNREQSSRQWWKWAYESLGFTTSRNPSENEMHGLQNLTELVKHRHFNFVFPLPDYTQELEAALWWRMGEAYDYQDDNQASEWYEKALSYLPNESSLKKALAQTYFSLAETYRSEKKYEQALADYTQTITLNPDDATAYHNRGYTYNELKKYELALADFNRFITLNPDDATAYNNRGYTYNELKKYKLALADYIQAITLNPNYAITYRNRGYTYHKLKKYELALADYTQAITLNPDDDTTYLNRGYTYNGLKKYELALADYTQAITLNPNDAAVYHNRGYTYHEMKKYELALADFNQSITLDPNDAAAYLNRGYIYHEMKKYELALVDYNQSILLDPNDANCYYRRGLTYTYLKQFAKATDDYRCALQGTWDNTYFVEYKCFLARGLLLGFDGKLKEGLSEMEKAIVLEPEEYEAYFWKGIFSAYFYKGRPHIAYAAIQKALELGMPPTLLTPPLYWLQEDSPKFFNTYAKSLLALEEGS